MTPAAQPQPPQPTSPVITAPSAPKSRLLFYLASGLTFIIIITFISFISLKIFDTFLKQKQSVPNQQNQAGPNYVAPEVSYPIYPGAIFIGNEKAPSCEEAPARGECGQTASIWQTSDSLDKVLNWYKSDHDGWKFEPFNDQNTNNNPVFGYLKNETDLPYTELYKNNDNTTTIKIFSQRP